MRAHTEEEAAFVVDTVAEWQDIYQRTLGRRLVYAADEYYLLANRPFPAAGAYDEFPQHENGIGMARAFVDGFTNPEKGGPGGVRHGFFASVDAAPAEGYRAIRLPPADDEPVWASPGTADRRPVTVLTGTYGARILRPLLVAHPRHDVACRKCPTTSSAAISGGRFAHGGGRRPNARHRSSGHPVSLARRLPQRGPFPGRPDLGRPPRAVEVVPTDGHSLRAALDGTSFRSACAA